MFLHKIPILAMVANSGLFANIIIIVLIIFSIITWTIIFTKLFQFRKQKKQLKKFFYSFSTYGDLLKLVEDKKVKGKEIGERLALEAVSEHVRIEEEIKNIKSRDNFVFFATTQMGILQSKMEQAVAREVQNNEWGVTTLAVATSVSPFIGLLGTVWGITHSFYDIGSMGSTSINIVAPGIAEALITTIMGLVVAIPCAVFYNFFTKEVRDIEGRMIDFATSLINDAKSFLLSNN